MGNAGYVRATSDQQQHLSFSATQSPQPTPRGGNVRGRSWRYTMATYCTFTNDYTNSMLIIRLVIQALSRIYCICSNILFSIDG